MGASIDRLEVQIETSAKEANVQLDKLTNKLDKLQIGLASIGSATNLGSLSTKIKGLNTNFNLLTSNSNKLFRSTNNLTAGFAKMYAGVKALERGFDAFRDSVSSSVGYIENLNYFNSAFNQVAEVAVSQWEDAGYSSANAYYESFSSRAKELTSKMTGFNINGDGTLTATGEASLGINPSKLMNYQAMFAQMSSSMGVSSETSLKLSQALTEIGADLASVKNMDFDKVWTDMASGLAGMSRTLDKYGVNIRNVNLQQKLTELGIEANITALNQNEKALLRTIILLDSTRYAWGNLANEITSPANQIRLLTSNLDNLSRTIGNLFLPALSATLPYINGFVIAAQRLFTWVGNLMGIDLSEITKAAGTSEVDFSELLGDTEDLTGNLDDASNAAKKLKSNLQGFDELNVISTQDTSGLTGIGSGMTSSLLDEAFNNMLSEYQAEWDEAFANMENRAEELADNFEKYFQPIKNIINDFAVGDFFSAGRDTSNLVAGIFDFFADAIDKVDWEGIGNNIGEFLGGIEWGEIFNSVGGFVWEGIQGAIELWKGSFDVAPIETAILTGLSALSLTGLGPVLMNLLSPKAIGTALIGGISGAFSVLGNSSLLANIGEMFALWSGGAGTLGESFAAVFGVSGTVVASFAAVAAGLGIVFVKNEEVRESFAESLNAIQGGLQPAIQFLTDTLLPDLGHGWNRILEVLSPLTDFLNGTFVSIWQDMINPALTYIGDTVLPKVAGAFENLWSNVLVPVGSILMDVLEPAVKIVSGAFEGLWKNVVVPLGDAVGHVFGKAFENVIDIFDSLVQKTSPVISFLQGLWDDGFEPLITGMWDKLKPTFDSVFGGIEKVIDGLGTTLGGVIDFLCGTFTSDWGKAWEGVKDVFKGAFNGVIGVLEGVLNIGIDGLNLFLGKLNSITMDLGDIIGIDISIPVIPKLDLPTFSTGGFPEDGLFMANRNELVGRFSNGKTAVANNQQITIGIADAVYPAVYDAVSAAIANSNRGNDDSDIVINMDGAEVFRVTRQHAKEYHDRTGRLAFYY